MNCYIHIYIALFTYAVIHYIHVYFSLGLKFLYDNFILELSSGSVAVADLLD